MPDVVGRKWEKKKLGELLGSKEGELLAVYGRRRIGKTYLISQFYRDKEVYFELSGIAGMKSSVQLARFPKAMRAAFNDPSIKDVPKDWFEAFDMLEKEVREIDEEKQVILFLDELPWLAARKQDLIRALEHSWNTYFSRRKNLILILCGSAAAWMIKKIINNRAGLYGRLTDVIHLKPFTLAETEEFLKEKGIELQRSQIIELYMAIGGVAKYLDFVKRGLSVAQNIQEICFSERGFLTTEFQDLFVSLFDDSKNHMRIIEVIAKHREGLGLSEIAAKLKMQPSGHLSTWLKELEAAGFIHSVPFFGNKKKNNRYSIADEYTLFYLTWIEPGFFSQHQHISSNYWQSQAMTPKYTTWSGYAFETICFKHIKQIVSALDLSVVALSASHWSCKPDEIEGVQGAQIDLIIDRRDKCMNLCEIKFTNEPVTITSEYAKKLNHKKNAFRKVTGTKKSLFTTLISANGSVKNGPYFSAIDQEIDFNLLF